MGFISEQFKKVKKDFEEHKKKAPERRKAKLASIRDDTQLLKARAQLEKQKLALKKVQQSNQPAPMSNLSPVSFSSEFDPKKKKPVKYGSDWNF